MRRLADGKGSFAMTGVLFMQSDSDPVVSLVDRSRAPAGREVIVLVGIVRGDRGDCFSFGRRFFENGAHRKHSHHHVTRMSTTAGSPQRRRKKLWLAPSASARKHRRRRNASADAPQPDPGASRRVAAAARRSTAAELTLSTMQESRTITRKSASNLALAFVLLPKARRDAMSALYAFCREVDDVADEDPCRWKSAANNWPPGARTSAAAVTERRRRNLRSTANCNRSSGISSAVRLFDELIKGCEMDLDIKRYEDYEQLGAILLPRRVRGRPVEHRDFRLPQSQPAAITRSISARRCS